MPKWVKLSEALEEPKKYGNLANIPVDYHPDSKSITFAPEQTGYPESQSFETEKDLEYYPVKLGLHVYLVARDCTKEALILRGREGYKYVKSIMVGYAKLYGNKELGAEGISWNKNTVEVLKKLPSFLRRVSGLYWTSMKYEFQEDECKYSGIVLIEHDTPFGDKGSTWLCMNNNGECGREAWVRPLILLPPDILVDVQNFDGGPLKIKRGPQENENTEISKLSQAQNETNAKEQVVAEKAMFDEIKEKISLISTISKEAFTYSQGGMASLSAVNSICRLSREILSIIGEIEKQNPTKA